MAVGDAVQLPREPRKRCVQPLRQLRKRPQHREDANKCRRELMMHEAEYASVGFHILHDKAIHLKQLAQTVRRIAGVIMR